MKSSDWNPSGNGVNIILSNDDAPRAMNLGYKVGLGMIAFAIGFLVVWLATAGAWTHGTPPRAPDVMITEAAGDTMITEGGDVMITE